MNWIVLWQTVDIQTVISRFTQRSPLTRHIHCDLSIFANYSRLPMEFHSIIHSSINLVEVGQTQTSSNKLQMSWPQWASLMDLAKAKWYRAKDLRLHTLVIYSWAYVIGAAILKLRLSGREISKPKQIRYYLVSASASTLVSIDSKFVLSSF